jgi:hypothetical protein
MHHHFYTFYLRIEKSEDLFILAVIVTYRTRYQTLKLYIFWYKILFLVALKALIVSINQVIKLKINGTVEKVRLTGYQKKSRQIRMQYYLHLPWVKIFLNIKKILQI